MAVFMASLREFKEDMTEEVTRIASKWSRQDQPCILKRSGRVMRCKWPSVEEVVEHVKETMWLLQSMQGPKVAAAIDSEGQAHKDLADRSEHGWATVAKHETDKLVFDSEDEKRITRAEKEAQKKAIARKKLKPAATTTTEDLVYSTARSTGTGAASGPRTRLIGPCFTCGQPGHLRCYCSELVKSPSVGV